MSAALQGHFVFFSLCKLEFMCLINSPVVISDVDVKGIPASGPHLRIFHMDTPLHLHTTRLPISLFTRYGLSALPMKLQNAT